jgi:hypothetical protein
LIGICVGPDNIGNLKKYRVLRWLKAVLESGPGSQTPLPRAFVDDPDRPPTAYPPGQWREFPVERAQRSGLAAFGVAYDSGRIARRFRSLGTLCDSQHLKHDERRDRACVQHNRGRRFQSFEAVSISDAEIEYLNWPRFVGFRQLAKADCPLVCASQSLPPLGGTDRPLATDPKSLRPSQRSCRSAAGKTVILITAVASASALGLQTGGARRNAGPHSQCQRGCDAYECIL